SFRMFVGVQTLYRMSGLFSTFFWLINRSKSEGTYTSLQGSKPLINAIIIKNGADADVFA
ncbi:hypothetical protein, partial [Paenibacillus borealis]|uniref:hypothetical protein n=1 Tax=Paenibacillus borealis TaxID=160799 RepID=UPI001C4D5381